MNAPMYCAEQLPVFQNRMFHSRAEARNCTKGDVVLVQDPASGLISNRSFRPELVRYDSDYHNEQDLSRVFQTHLQNVSEIIMEHFQKCSLLEIGCGKGHFLEMLQRLGFEVTGLDPAYEGSNPAIVKEYFSPAVGLTGDGIILRHVLEHVQDPVSFLASVRQANGGSGRIYIEVPCFDWICNNRAWFDICYEHVNYFRLSDFERMFGRIYALGHCFSGQYLYVVADLAALRAPSADGTAPFAFPANFLDNVNKYAARLKTQEKTRRAVWGAATKGVIFTLFMERAGAQIDMVVDINPAKQGRFLAATGLQVQSPEVAMKTLPHGTQVYVMNGNYLDEIRVLTNGQFDCLAVDHESF